MGRERIRTDEESRAGKAGPGPRGMHKRGIAARRTEHGVCRGWPDRPSTAI